MPRSRQAAGEIKMVVLLLYVRTSRMPNDIILQKSYKPVGFKIKVIIMVSQKVLDFIHVGLHVKRENGEIYRLPIRSVYKKVTVFSSKLLNNQLKSVIFYLQMHCFNCSNNFMSNCWVFLTVWLSGNNHIVV